MNYPAASDRGIGKKPLNRNAASSGVLNPRLRNKYGEKKSGLMPHNDNNEKDAISAIIPS